MSLGADLLSNTFHPNLTLPALYSFDQNGLPVVDHQVGPAAGYGVKLVECVVQDIEGGLRKDARSGSRTIPWRAEAVFPPAIPVGESFLAKAIK